MNLSDALLKALKVKHYTVATPIQEQAIPVALEKRDLLGIAQTGTGKTAAFSLPIIQLLQEDQRSSGPRPIKALILTPTRELAIQIEENVKDYTRYTSLRSVVIFGGVKQAAQVRAIKQGVDILIATPGRLLDLISQRIISLKQVKHFVLDEADRMLDMGFVHDIKRILPLLPKQRQTLFFSATMPDTIASLAKRMLDHPVKVEVAPESSVIDNIEQQLFFVEKPDKMQVLVDVLREDDKSSTLVFSRTKRGADRIAKRLKQKGIFCEAIHGDKAQNARQRALSNFKSGKSNVIVATDIAARGIDINSLAKVINYDLPDAAETYVHRIGRTGRAGKKGLALSLCSSDERKMLRDIQKLTGKRIPAATHTA